MKILCLIDGLSQGGAERQMIGLAYMLKNQGFSVTLSYYCSDDFYLNEAKQKGIHVDYIATGNTRWSKVKAIKKYIKAEGGFDVLIAYKDGPAVIGCILKVLGAKFRLVVSERNTNVVKSRYDIVKFNFYRFADAVVPNSFSQKAFIDQNFPFLRDKTSTITNFTDTSFFEPTKIKKDNNKIQILTAARISSQKNIKKYIEAVYRVREAGYHNFEVIWYGDVSYGEEEYKNECIQKIKNLNLNEFFKLKPATKDILSKYQYCDVFCLPSLYEGYPNVVCEAMSCGRPIICSNVCDNSFLVENNKNGLLFEPNDVASISEAIITVLKIDKKQLEQWGTVSRQKSIVLFSQDTFIQKYINLIR